jgi:hypothetical protein
MSKALWDKIDRELGKHEYMQGIARSSERVSQTAEVFTPSALVLEILRYLDLNLFAPGKTVLDPACGDGQFLSAAKWVKVFHFKMTETEALADIFGVDIMRDNVDLCRRRLGGGTIVMGNTLNPIENLPGQTDWDREKMRELFVVEMSVGSKRKFPRKGNASESESTLF